MYGLVGVSGVLAFVALVGTVIFSIFAMVVVLKARSRQKQLERHGEVAQGRILGSVLLPPSKFGDRARFTLEVHRVDGRVYQAECRHRVHALHAPGLQLGGWVELRVDPHLPERVSIIAPLGRLPAFSLSSPSEQRSPQKPRLAQAGAPSAQSPRREWPPTP